MHGKIINSELQIMVVYVAFPVLEECLCLRYSLIIDEIRKVTITFSKLVGSYHVSLFQRRNPIADKISNFAVFKTWTKKKVLWMLSIEKGGYKHERDLYQGFFPCYYVLNSYHKSYTSEIFFFYPHHRRYHFMWHSCHQRASIPSIKINCFENPASQKALLQFQNSGMYDVRSRYWTKLGIHHSGRSNKATCTNTLHDTTN